MELTPRIKNWIENFGIDVALTDETGQVSIIVAEKTSVDGEKITIALSQNQMKQIEDILLRNDYVALAPGQLDLIHTQYQFKGSTQVLNYKLEVEVSEIYSTEPGPEAGIRLNVLGYDIIQQYDEAI